MAKRIKRGAERPMKMMPVIFRRWSKAEGGGLIACLPTEPASCSDPYLFDAYAPRDGWAAASWAGIVAHTEPAKSEEYADLMTYLEGVTGARLVPYKRWMPMFTQSLLAKWNVRRTVVQGQILAGQNGGAK